MSENQTVTLQSLCGQHLLSGRGEMVLRSNETSSDDAYVVVLVLDDVFYWFQEDPSDGYRSDLGFVKRLLGYPQNMPSGAFAKFDPILVTLRVRTGAEDPDIDSLRTDEVLYGLDERTGLVLFELGTVNIFDYYPCFVHNWTPEGVEAKWLVGRED